MHFASRYQFHAGEVTRTQRQISVVFGSIHQERSLLHSQAVERLAETAGFRFSELKTLDYSELAVSKLGGQRRAQRALQLFSGKLVIVRTRLRSMNRAAMSPKRRADRAYAGPSGSLLLPQLFACAGDQLFVVGGMSPGPMGGAIMLDRLPQQVFIHRAEDLCGQLQRAYFFAV